MNDSILQSTKKLLGIIDDYSAFDQDIIVFINSAFSTLAQLGVGPKEGFVIQDESTDWDEFIAGRTDIESVKSYIYMKVRMAFDPPQSSAAIESMKQMISEAEWRLNVTCDVKE